ncbi:reverse transcriptase domain-containing protein [Tanacetum coccineum]
MRNGLLPSMGKHVVVAKVIEGMEFIKKIEQLGTSDGKPSGLVISADYGEISEDKKGVVKSDNAYVTPSTNVSIGSSMDAKARNSAVIIRIAASALGTYTSPTPIDRIAERRSSYDSSSFGDDLSDLAVGDPSEVKEEYSTQPDGAQSSRVPVPLPEDPYEAIRQAYLDGTDTESEPFEDPTDTETPESPLAIAPPVLVPILRRTARMAVRVPHAMSSGLSANLPLRKRYRGTYELVEGSEEDDGEEDEGIEESMDSNSVSEDAEDEGPTTEDEDPAVEDEGLTAGVEGPGIDDKDYDLDYETHGRDDEDRGIDDEGHSVESDGLGLEEEEVVPGGQQQAAPVVRTNVSAPLGLGYGALRRRELALKEGDVYSTFEVGQGSGLAPGSERPERVSTFRQPTLTTWTNPEDCMIYIDIPNYPPPAPPVQTPPSPEWTSGSLPISPSHSDVPSPISSPMIPLTIPSPVATPATVETDGFLTELGAQGHRWRRFSLRGQTDTHRAAPWHAVSDVQGENQDLRLHLAEERRTRLELTKVVDGMRRGQEPRGGQTDAYRATLWHAISDVQGENQDLRLQLAKDRRA